MLVSTSIAVVIILFDTLLLLVTFILQRLGHSALDNAMNLLIILCVLFELGIIRFVGLSQLYLFDLCQEDFILPSIMSFSGAMKLTVIIVVTTTLGSRFQIVLGFVLVT